MGKNFICVGEKTTGLKTGRLKIFLKIDKQVLPQITTGWRENFLEVNKWVYPSI